MWHWNSLLTPTTGAASPVTDPSLWQTPWSAEQVIAMQAQGWNAMLSASQTWWSMLLAAWPATPGWPMPGWSVPQVNPAASAGIEPLVAKPELPAKRAPRPRSRNAIQARKR